MNGVVSDIYACLWNGTILLGDWRLSPKSRNKVLVLAVPRAPVPALFAHRPAGVLLKKTVPQWTSRVWGGRVRVLLCMYYKAVQNVGGVVWNDLQHVPIQVVYSVSYIGLHVLDEC